MNERTSEVLAEGFTDLVVVCTNDRDADYACCGGVGGDQVAAAVREWLRERDAFWTHVYVVETSCLGLCSSDGAALAVQPRNEWYSGVDADEVPALLESVFGADATDLGAPA
jgi:(2Fe-2S) ferredoxin